MVLIRCKRRFYTFPPMSEKVASICVVKCRHPTTYLRQNGAVPVQKPVPEVEEPRKLSVLLPISRLSCQRRLHPGPTDASEERPPTPLVPPITSTHKKLSIRISIQSTLNMFKMFLERWCHDVLHE